MNIYQLENEFHWNNIKKLVAYKEDKITYDEICIDCIFIDGNEYTMREDTPGWKQFIKHLEENLDLLDNWLEKVMKPAFTRNETLIYLKENKIYN